MSHQSLLRFRLGISQCVVGNCVVHLLLGFFGGLFVWGQVSSFPSLCIYTLLLFLLLLGFISVIKLFLTHGVFTFFDSPPHPARGSGGSEQAAAFYFVAVWAQTTTGKNSRQHSGVVFATDI